MIHLLITREYVVYNMFNSIASAFVTVLMHLLLLHTERMIKKANNHCLELPPNIFGNI